MHRSDVPPDAPQTRPTRALWPALTTLALVLVACSPGPATSSLTASQGGGATSSESASASPSAATSASPEGDTLTGNWTGTWAIDPPYAGVAGGFTMEIVDYGGPFSGTVELTNSDCGDGTVNGSVSGTSVTFGWVTTKQPVQFVGTLDGMSSMSGTWASVACSDPSISLTGTWEATKKP